VSLVKAVQQQQAEIETLRADNDNLRSLVAEQGRQIGELRTQIKAVR
jgi:hypothetical protein